MADATGTTTEATATTPRPQLTPEELRARGAIGARLAELLELSEGEPQRAAADAWEWFNSLGQDKDEKSLDELFTLGVARPMEGPTDGILLALFVNPLLDSFAMALMGPGRMTAPWTGKTFDPETQTGTNNFKGWYPPIARMVFPRYRGIRREQGKALMFDNENGIVPDPLDPSHAVWKIEYSDPAQANPLFIKDVFDALVEIVPGANLGRIEHNGKSGFKNLGYFALKPASD
jgi:hypothetical protein